jgi:membrane protease YdiL (CAAX protease family)
MPIRVGTEPDRGAAGIAGGAVIGEGQQFAMRMAATEKRLEGSLQLRRPLVAVLLQGLVPGAGYLYLGDPLRAAGSASLFAMMTALAEAPVRNAAELTAVSNLRGAAASLYLYTLFDAYRTAWPRRNERGDAVVIRDDFWRLVVAPYDPGTYRSWKVAAMLALGAAVTGGTIAESGVADELSVGEVAVALPLLLGSYTLVGLGEEALHRGVVQGGLLDAGVGPWTSNVLQSLHFGLMHTPYGELVEPPLVLGQLVTAARRGEFSWPSSMGPTGWERFVETGLIGLWLGYIAQSEQDGLRKAITAHVAWDILVGLRQLVTTGTASPFFFTIGGGW